MQLVPYRLLRNEPGALRRLLEQEGELVVTSNNEPFALMLDISGEDVDEVVLLVSRIRVQKAVGSIRLRAREAGLDEMTMEEIDAEIDAARAERKTRSTD